MTDKDNQDKKKKNAQLYLDMQMINQQLLQTQKQIQTIEESVNELMIAVQGLDEFKDIKQGKEILVPVVGGIFAKAELKENKELIVNIGSDTAVTKSVDDVKNMLNKQVEGMQNTQQKLIENLQEFSIKAKDIENKLTKLSKENV
ncbi:MAG: prefoldin subunit alpha [Nanoarchaeota archaeon]|nr:prefoldin subunit alpha [Nanoarchaeota archaeon]